MTVITNLYYLPSIGHFVKIVDAKSLVLECKENYLKRSLRNRCWLAGPNGKVSISIPLQKGKNSGQNIKEVRISKESEWSKIHWKSILTSYSTSPYLDYYKDSFHDIYLQKFDFLWDFNLTLYQKVLDILHMDKKLSYTSTFEKSYNKPLVDHRDNFTSSKPLMPIPSYPQVFSYKYDFISDLSIFDAIMCLGPETSNYIRQVKII